MFRVLSVDNNVTRANLTARAVMNLKFGVRMNYALSATQALLYIAGVKSANKVLPDMILLSAQLPDTCGLDALQTISEALQVHHIPIIMLADKKSAHNGAEYFKCGACAYVVRGSNVDAYTADLGQTVTFVAMVEGLIPKQPAFFPQEQAPQLTIKDVLQVYL